jgi:hypothetical protein
VQNLLKAIEERDSMSMAALLTDFQREMRLFYDFDQNYASTFINHFEKSYPGFNVFKVNDDDIEVKAFLANELIRVQSKQYDALYYGYVKSENGEDDYFELKKLPGYLIIRNGRPLFIL